jgi:cellulose biosynthesis protein BcsQ
VVTKIALFNNKGGVSKTTTTFNLGWMLAERGHRVVVVDADPQCNLTGMVLDVGEEGSLDQFYSEYPKRNLKAALDPAFKSRPVPLEPVECVEVPKRPGMFLVPGHVGLAEDETSLGIAQQLSESVQGLRNLPGSFAKLFDLTAERYQADVMLLDLSPGLGAINQNLVATSDFFLVPCSPDIFSVMAIDSLARVLPRWNTWAQRAAELEALSEADYPFPSPHLKFLGVLIQRFRPRGGKATQAFQTYFDKLDAAVKTTFVPALQRSGMMLDEQAYIDCGMEGTYIASQIADFNTLIANSQQLRKPVFTLSAGEIKRGGQAGAAAEANIETFRQNFEELALRVEVLAGLGTPSANDKV